MGEPPIRSLVRKVDILFLAFKNLAELQDDKNEKIKAVYDKAIVDIESINEKMNN